ncbi:MAG: hypothetical protein H5U02_09030 [Clostridia bacterium]|nr:hypothetical protein [Clostridia bacterium]
MGERWNSSPWRAGAGTGGEAVNCPNCGSSEVGKIGLQQYYCWNCMVEYNDKREVFAINEDGSLEHVQIDS